MILHAVGLTVKVDERPTAQDSVPWLRGLQRQTRASLKNGQAPGRGFSRAEKVPEKEPKIPGFSRWGALALRQWRHLMYF